MPDQRAEESTFTLEALERAATIVYATLDPTPQFAWPLLGDELGAEVVGQA